MGKWPFLYHISCLNGMNKRNSELFGNVDRQIKKFLWIK